MRIDRLDLVSYGHLRDQSLDLTAEPGTVVLVVGPNEAGKSTTMRALDALLFGIERTSRDHFGMGKASLRIGAELTASDGRTMALVRQGLASQPLVTADGAPIADSELAAMLGHVDRTLFRTLFRIDHTELIDGSESLLAADGEIGRLVFGASLGSTALTGALRTLGARQAQLFKPRATTTRVNAALNEYRKLAKSARERRVRPKQWNDLQHARRELDAQIDDAQARIGRLHADRSRLERVASALPKLAARRATLDELHELARHGPIAAPEQADVFQQLLADRDAAHKLLDAAARQRKALDEQLAALEVDEGVLSREADIAGLVEGLGRYRKDVADLPDVQAKVDGHHQVVGDLLSRLGHDTTADVDALVALTDVERERIEHLAETKARLDAEQASAHKELADLDDRLAALRSEIADLVEPPDTGALVLARDEATRLGPIEDQLLEALGEVSRLEQEATARRGRMGLEATPLDAIEATVVPMRAQANAEARARADHDNRLHAVDDRIADSDRRRDDLQRQRDDIVPPGGLASREELLAARTHRDAGWRLVRSVLDGEHGTAPDDAWSDGAPLPDAFERAVHRADRIADDRYDHAEVLAKLEHLDTALVAIHVELASLAEERASVVAAANSSRRQWEEQWAHLPIAMLDPEQLTSWLDDHHELLDLLRRRREAGSRAEVLAATIAVHRERLAATLTAIGRTPNDTTLVDLLGDATEVIARAEADRRAHQAAREQLATLERARHQRVADEAHADAQLAAWQADWARAVTAIGLPADAAPAAATTTVRLLGELRDAHSNERSDSRRLAGLAADIAAYEATARPVIEALAPASAGDDVAAAVSALDHRLRATIKASGKKEEAQTQLDGLVASTNDAEATITWAANRLAEELSLLGLPDDTDVRAVVARTVAAADAEASLAGHDEVLLAIGGGRTVAEIAAEADEVGHDGDRVAAQLEKTNAEVATTTDELESLREQRATVHAEINRIDGSGVAADLEQDAQDALARTAAAVEEYLHVTLAAALLERVVRDYGQAHQRPLLDDAAALFRSLTGGAFDDLIVDHEGDRQVLIARRRNGDHLQTSELSSGTRDQLYLALRLAGVRHQLGAMAEPVPLILDDLLINFDDDRAVAALGALADLSHDTQVLMFTHERDLARLALDALGPARCRVVHLEPRDHDAPPLERAAGGPSASGRAASRAVTDHDEDAEQVLAALRQASSPLGKADLLAQSGLDASHWSGAIRTLLERGVVVQEGAKRGTKYRAVD